MWVPNVNDLEILTILIYIYNIISKNKKNEKNSFHFAGPGALRWIYGL
jgi:hypothetical protein